MAPRSTSIADGVTTAAEPAAVPDKPTAKNPVEKRIALMRDLWLQATEDPSVRIVVWRLPDNADRMLLAFYEAQRHEGDWQTQDLYIKFDAPFETGFSYSRSLCDALIETYVASDDSFKEQGIALNWPFARVPRPDSASGFLGLLGDFARHHAKHFRHAAAALMPATVTSPAAWQAWVQAAVKSGVPAGVQLALVDSHSLHQWDALAKDFPAMVRVIEPPVDMFDIARETAAQSPSAGPAVAYRQLLTDVLVLVEKGTPAQTSARADKALKIAEREAWHDQQVVVHMAVAGAHLKAQDCPAAIKRYRQARVCAEEAKRQGNPVGSTLVMQTWFGEAGAWFVAKQLRQAAQAYRSAAEEAQRVPNQFFSLEGFRMASYCYARHGDTEDARSHGALAVREGQAMKPDERLPSTLGIALNDLLRLQDSERVSDIEKLVSTYQADMARAHADAEKAGAALGPTPKNVDVDRIEAEMHQRFETAFQTLREQREKLIVRGDDYFRKVVAVGRDLLHPEWSGMPEVKHPLDKDQPMWTKMPSSAALPAPGPLDDAPTAVAAPAAPAQVPA
jgi:tetratricopeptide (TPR) repeat protein